MEVGKKEPHRAPLNIDQAVFAGSLKLHASETPNDRFINVVDYMQSLNDYMNASSIDFRADVIPARTKKIRDHGGFGGRWIGVRDGKPKLVRDNYHSSQEEQDRADYHQATEEEYAQALGEKVLEEARELIAARTREKKIGELADAFEVITAYMRVHNIDSGLVERKRQTREVELRRERRKRKI